MICTETLYFCNYNPQPMKNSSIVLLGFAAMLSLSACSKKEETLPCDGNGVLNVENKLDSTISVKVTETHSTKSIGKDYTLPFTLAGDQPYTLTIDGPSYHKDTTFMLLNCDNKLFIVSK